MEPFNTFVLISCSKKKISYPAPAKILYDSPLFKNSRSYAEAITDSWFVLSAKYGLLLPDEMVEPYDLALWDLSNEEKLLWVRKVLDAIVKNIPIGSRIIILAGKKYVELILNDLLSFGFNIETPLSKIIGIGNRISWLKNSLPNKKTHGHFF